VTRDERDALYWRKNIRMVLALLVLWAIPPFALSIFGVEWLDRFRLGGFPLGFWFAQQGSIVIFVLLILVYALYMDRLDRAFRGEGEEES
jgi:putative solute:sodium symporter small subunit